MHYLETGIIIWNTIIVSRFTLFEGESSYLCAFSSFVCVLSIEWDLSTKLILRFQKVASIHVQRAFHILFNFVIPYESGTMVTLLPGLLVC